MSVHKDTGNAEVTLGVSATCSEARGAGETSQHRKQHDIGMSCFMHVLAKCQVISLGTTVAQRAGQICSTLEITTAAHNTPCAWRPRVASASVEEQTDQTGSKVVTRRAVRAVADSDTTEDVQPYDGVVRWADGMRVLGGSF
jgi:hypothetical protein